MQKFCFEHAYMIFFCQRLTNFTYIFRTFGLSHQSFLYFLRILILQSSVDYASRPPEISKERRGQHFGPRSSSMGRKRWKIFPNSLSVPIPRLVALDDWRLSVALKWPIWSTAGTLSDVTSPAVMPNQAHQYTCAYDQWRHDRLLSFKDLPPIRVRVEVTFGQHVRVVSVGSGAWPVKKAEKRRLF